MAEPRSLIDFVLADLQGITKGFQNLVLGVRIPAERNEVWEDFSAVGHGCTHFETLRQLMRQSVTATLTLWEHPLFKDLSDFW